jgi:hypothetical protein
VAPSIHLRWIVNLNTCLVQGSPLHPQGNEVGTCIRLVGIVQTSGLTAADGRISALDKWGLIRVRHLILVVRIDAMVLRHRVADSLLVSAYSAPRAGTIPS